MRSRPRRPPADSPDRGNAADRAERTRLSMLSLEELIAEARLHGMAADEIAEMEAMQAR